jgi:hypothetical protein
MSGGKGGESSTEMKLPPWLEAESKELIARGKELAKLPPLPYSGLTMAAPSSMTKQGLVNSNAAANALGIGTAGDILAGLPQETEMDGMSGYRAYDLYQSEVDRQRELNPNLMSRYEQLSPSIFGETPFGQGTPGSPGPGGGYGPAYPTPPGGGGAGGGHVAPGSFDPYGAYADYFADLGLTIDELRAMYGGGFMGGGIRG